jgi:hypothetical protein
LQRLYSSVSFFPFSSLQFYFFSEIFQFSFVLIISLFEHIFHNYVLNANCNIWVICGSFFRKAILSVS